MKAHTSKVMFWLKLEYTLISFTLLNINYNLNTSVVLKWCIGFSLIYSDLINSLIVCINC